MGMDRLVGWATYFAVCLFFVHICISACNALWNVAKSLETLTRRDFASNMHPMVLELREVKKEIKQFAAVMSLAIKCH
jgi:hypothetical protein